MHLLACVDSLALQRLALAALSRKASKGGQLALAALIDAAVAGMMMETGVLCMALQMIGDVAAPGNERALSLGFVLFCLPLVTNKTYTHIFTCICMYKCISVHAYRERCIYIYVSVMYGSSPVWSVPNYAPFRIKSVCSVLSCSRGGPIQSVAVQDRWRSA